jgi:hypothetical protein
MNPADLFSHEENLILLAADCMFVVFDGSLSVFASRTRSWRIPNGSFSKTSFPPLTS